MENTIPKRVLYFRFLLTNPKNVAMITHYSEGAIHDILAFVIFISEFVYDT